MTTFTLEIHDQAVRAALAALSARVADMQPVLHDIGEGILQRTKARFDTSTGPDGQTWQAKKTPNGYKTLVGETGDLRRQIASSVSGNTLTVQATAKYAAIHQFGGTIERPARQVTVRHRTDAKGNLLRSAIMNGKGLIFAKASHKRAVARTFAAKAYRIKMPARPFLPVRADGSLYADEQQLILAQINAWLADDKA